MQFQHLIEWGTQFSCKFDLSSNRNILDLGCRQGQLSAHLAQRYPQQQFIAIDNLESEIEKAQQHHFANLDFKREDALTLKFFQEFDAVVSFNCLLWIKNKQKALQNVFEALKPGGKAFFQFFVRHGYPKNDRFLYQTALLPSWRSYFKNFHPNYYEISIGECCLLLENCGFNINQLHLVRYPFAIEEPSDLFQLLKSWASHINYLPTNKHDHFLYEVVLSYYHTHQLSQHESFNYYEYLIELICEKPFQNRAKVTKSHYCYGDYGFTLREVQVLKRYLSGKSAKEIALSLDLSAKTIEFHLAKIKDKLSCHKRSEIYEKALSNGVIQIMFDTTL